MNRTHIVANISVLITLGLCPVKASNIHGMDEIRDENLRHPIKRQVAQPIHTENKENITPQFPGKGYRLGGDPYVNRSLGIEHDEGKRLAKARKHHKKENPFPHFNMNFFPYERIHG